jgi:two-component system OmpR family response regulator
MAEPSRILVVDDEPSITDLLSMALRYEGMEVEVSHMGREALEAMTKFRPHLVVLDVMLPDLSGFEVLERMGRDRIGGRLPVLFLTARDTLDDKLRGFTLGGDDYMTKPFSVEELIVRVRAILRRAHGDGAQR